MNYSNMVMFIAAFTTSLIFFGSVFVNLQIKNARLELIELYEKTESIKNDIKRQKIEIASLSNPELVLEFIDEEGMEPTPVERIKILEIEEQKREDNKDNNK